MSRTRVITSWLFLVGLSLAGCSRQTKPEDMRQKAIGTEGQNSAVQPVPDQAEQLKVERTEDQISAREWIQQLNEGDVVGRTKAASALGNMGSDAVPAVSALEVALEDESPEVRVKAAEALKRIGPSAAAAAPALLRILVDALKQGTFTPRQVVHRSDSGDVPTIGVIFPPDTCPSDAQGKKRINSIWNVGSKRVPAILTLGPPAEGVKHRPSAFRGPSAFLAAESLAFIGAGAVPPLAKAVHDESEHVRFAAVYALYCIALPHTLTDSAEADTAVTSLSEALRDKSEDVRIVAAGSLGLIGPDARSAVMRLREALKDDSADVRFWATHALGAIGMDATSAEPDIERLLDDESQYVRAAADEAIRLIRARKEKRDP